MSCLLKVVRAAPSHRFLHFLPNIDSSSLHVCFLFDIALKAFYCLTRNIGF